MVLVQDLFNFPFRMITDHLWSWLERDFARVIKGKRIPVRAKTRDMEGGMNRKRRRKVQAIGNRTDAFEDGIRTGEARCKLLGWPS